MQTRSSMTASLKHRLALLAENLRKQADAMPPGPGREELIDRAQRIESAARTDGWLSRGRPK
jgi:hypothetical protein